MPAFTRQDVDWGLILRKIRNDRCVPFLGAGASMGEPGEVGLPTASELAKRLALQCQYPGPDKTDFLRVAQYFQIKEDALELRLAVHRELSPSNSPSGSSSVTPGKVHRALAALPFTYILTTNFDTLMESALVSEGKRPRVHMYRLRGDKTDVNAGTCDEPVVYKLHGSLENLDSLVVTEDDVVEFLSCIMLSEPPLPSRIQALFEEKSILFIGYGLKDWNIRVLMRAIRRKRAATSIASFAIQRRPTDEGLAKEWEESVVYWDKKEGLRCFDMDAADFCTELKRHFDEAQ
jgi:hypothetical protein